MRRRGMPQYPTKKNMIPFAIRRNIHRHILLSKSGKRFQKTFTAFGQENMPMNVSSDGKGNHIFLRWVLRHPTATHVLRRAEQHNVFIGDWHGSPLVPSGVSYTAFHFNPATCPIACRAAKEIIPFPTHPQIGEKEIERLACLFKN